MPKIRKNSNTKKILFILGIILLTSLGVGFWFLNKEKNVSPTDSDAGTSLSCLSRVEILTPAESCGGSTYKSATYKCVGGFTSKIGSSGQCLTKTQLNEIATTVCNRESKCTLMKNAYSETFSSTTFNKSWIVSNPQPYGTKTFRSNGLILKNTKVPVNYWNEIRLNDQNINEDFYFEVKGVGLSNVEGANNLFSVRGSSPATSGPWTTAFGPSADTLNRAVLNVKVVNGVKTLVADYVVNGIQTNAASNNITITGSNIDFRIYKLGNILTAQYNMGKGYITAYTIPNFNWVHNYVLLSTYAPVGKSVTGSYKSFTYKNQTGKFAFKTVYSTTFTSAQIKSNWGTDLSDSNFTYKPTESGLILKNRTSNKSTSAFWGYMRLNKRTSGDVIYTFKGVNLSPTTVHDGRVFVRFFGWPYSITSVNDQGWDQAWMQIGKNKNKLRVEAGYSESKHTLWRNSAKNFDLPSGVTTVDFRMRKIASTIMLDVNYGGGYKNMVTYHNFDLNQNFPDIGIYSPVGTFVKASIKSLTIETR